MARINAGTGSTLAEFSDSDTPASITVLEGAVWVANLCDGTVSCIDPATNRILAAIGIRQRGFLRPAAGEGRIWEAAWLDKVVKGLDPATNQVMASVPAEV